MGTHDVADLWPEMRGEGGDNPGNSETEEEQSGLITLLQQIPLAELREIARQRGWRIKGPSKADYAPALAALLTDPTETARAVTGLPENLREALRAAFVADDGSGISATMMAQTMTALRGAAGPTIKPVEAAGLLSDLARWGLVLQWSDSLYGRGRHILPWQVQRLVPPLPGWCPPSAAVPATPTQCRDARQVVDSLCTVWKSLAAEQPAVRAPVSPPRATVGPRSGPARNAGWSTDPAQNAGWSTDPAHPANLTGRSSGKERRPDEGVLPAAKTPAGGVPAERMGERRFLSMIQGWPYDPQELQDWASNRRRSGTAVQTLLVPPTPFLVEDPTLIALADSADGDGHGLAEGDGEQLEFLCRVLGELDLVRIQSGHLVGQHQQMARFLQLSVPDQHRAGAQAYLALLDWSELDVLRRRDTRLMLWRKPYFSLPYEQFRSVLVQLRHLLLRFLACAGEDTWCALGDVETALRKLWPHFAAALQGERQSWLVQAWGLAWREEGRRQDQAPAGWEASQGALLRVLLEGPLQWLGFAELSYSSGQLAAFRLHGLASWIWDRPTARLDVEGKVVGEALAVDEGGEAISLQPGSVPPQAHAFLGRIARLEEASPERFLYRLDAQTALATFESGASLSDLITDWERALSQPIPAAVREMLGQFWTRYGQVRLYEGFSLLELDDEVTLRELEAGTSLSQHIVARLSPHLVVVPEEAVETLMREFAAKDYMPKEVE